MSIARKAKKLALALSNFLLITIASIKDVFVMTFITNILTIVPSLKTLAFNTKNFAADSKMPTLTTTASLLLKRIFYIYYLFYF